MIFVILVDSSVIYFYSASSSVFLSNKPSSWSGSAFSVVVADSGYVSPPSFEGSSTVSYLGSASSVFFSSSDVVCSSGVFSLSAGFSESGSVVLVSSVSGYVVSPSVDSLGSFDVSSFDSCF